MSTKKFKWLAVELEGSAVVEDKQDEAAEDAGDKRDDVDKRVEQDTVAVDTLGVSASRDS